MTGTAARRSFPIVLTANHCISTAGVAARRCLRAMVLPAKRLRRQSRSISETRPRAAAPTLLATSAVRGRDAAPARGEHAGRLAGTAAGTPTASPIPATCTCSIIQSEAGASGSTPPEGRRDTWPGGGAINLVRWHTLYDLQVPSRRTWSEGTTPRAAAAGGGLFAGEYLVGVHTGRATNGREFMRAQTRLRRGLQQFLPADTSLARCECPPAPASTSASAASAASAGAGAGAAVPSPPFRREPERTRRSRRAPSPSRRRRPPTRWRCPTRWRA